MSQNYAWRSRCVVGSCSVVDAALLTTHTANAIRGQIPLQRSAADHGKRLVVKCTVSYLRVNESISGVPGDNRTERISLRPTVPRRMPVFSVGGGSHWPQAKPRRLQGD